VVRVDELGINDALHVSDLQLPEGVKSLTPGEALVAHVAAAAEEVEEEPEAVEPGPSEPEVIGKGKQETSEE
jgi:large subunit ribosomal protein L25